jgi:phenylacetate-CoA ligase
MRWVNEERLEELLVHVRDNPHSDFYKKKYAGLPIDAEHFFNLPMLTRAELVGTPMHDRLFVPRREVNFIAVTSGTTSSVPLMMPFSAVDNYFFEPSLGTGITRPLLMHPALVKSFAYTFLQQCQQAEAPVSPVFGDLTNMENNALLCKELECDALYALPTSAALFAGPAARRGAVSGIKLLALASEMLTVARRRELNTAFPGARIANVYGSTEIGQFILFPCTRIMDSGENIFHTITKALATIELIEGELIVSYGLNRAAPLLRYRTGDYFEDAAGECDCGLPGPLLRWSHRSDVDRIKINGMEFDAESSDRAFATFPHVAELPYQVHFRGTGDATSVALTVELEDKSLAQDSARAADFQRFVERELPDIWKISSTATVRTALDAGLISEFTVRIVPARSSVGTKIRRFVNHVA